MSEFTMVEVTVTCATEGCLNSGIPITFTVPEGCQIVCGVCGSDITGSVR